MTRAVFINVLDKRALKYVKEAEKLLEKHKKKLFDDFFFEEISNQNLILKILDISYGNFWFILDSKSLNFAGLVFLDDFIGNKNNNHSAQISVCFMKQYFGSFVLDSAKIFIPFVFRHFDLNKLYAHVYDFNLLAKKLIRQVGFKLEAKLKAHTILNGKMQDVCVFSLIRDHTNESFDHR